MIPDMPTAELLEEMLQSAQIGAQDVGNSFEEPDEDWSPILFYGNKDGIGVDEIPMTFFASSESKDYLGSVVLPGFIRVNAIKAIVLITSTWAVDMSDMSAKERESAFLVAPSEHPFRKEWLMLTGYTAFETKIVSANIIRHSDAPPTLTPFVVMPTDFTFAGRLVDDIQTALRPQG